MCENLSKAPVKSILKSSSFDQRSEPDSKSDGASSTCSSTSTKTATFDEMNILETYHPPDKDYGHMRIEEPKTPFSHYSEVDPEELAERLKEDLHEEPKERKDSTSEDEEGKSGFQEKRSKHYNEFYAVKLARKLMEEEGE